MTSPARVLAILDLFTQEHPIWHPDDINGVLGYSRATGYRYVKDLVEAGFLQKVSAGGYALGARIIELDYQLRQSDPVLLAAAPVMEALASRSKFDAVLSTMFGGSQIVDTHRASHGPALQLQYGRGRPRPLFQGAAPKVILSALTRPQLKRLYDEHADEARAAGLGTHWEAFRTRMAEIREAGAYLSLGELDRGVGAAAVPVFNADGEVAAALTLVGTIQAIRKAGLPSLQRQLQRAATQIHDRL